MNALQRYQELFALALEGVGLPLGGSSLKRVLHDQARR